MLFSKKLITPFQMHNYLRSCDLIYKNALKVVIIPNNKKIIISLNNGSIMLNKSIQIKLFLFLYIFFGQVPYLNIKKSTENLNCLNLKILIKNKIFIYQIVSNLFLENLIKSSLIFSLKKKTKKISYNTVILKYNFLKNNSFFHINISNFYNLFFSMKIFI